MPIGDIAKCRSPKNGKNCGFSPPEDDRINRSRRNFAGKRRPWVCYSTPNLALISKRRLVQGLPKVSKCAQNCGFWPPEADTMNTFIWNLACKCRPWICCTTPNLALIGKRRSVQELPKMSKFAENCGFWPPEADNMNTLKWNLACKCRPWVRSSTPNLILIGKRGSVQESPNMKNCQKLWFLTTGSRHNEHIQMKFGI